MATSTKIYDIQKCLNEKKITLDKSRKLGFFITKRDKNIEDFSGNLEKYFTVIRNKTTN